MSEKKNKSKSPTAVELLRKFLVDNKLQIKVAPLKTWYDESGRFVIDPPQIVVDKQHEKEE